MSDTRSPRYGQVNREYGMKLATTPPDEDGPVWMVNLMKYKEVADYADGRPSNVSGREADDIYAPVDVLGDIGAQIVFVADVDQQLLGDSPTWDRVAIAKYPTRRAFIEMQSRPDFKDKHAHKDAGMEFTIVCGCLPIASPTMPAGVAEVDWADVAHPPTAEDGPVVVLHVLRFDAESASHVTPDEMAAYQSAAAAVAVPLVFASMGGSPSKARSSATGAGGIRCGSTSSRARRRSWQSPRTRPVSQRRRLIAKWLSPTPTR